VFTSQLAFILTVPGGRIHMFRTYPESEMLIPSALATDGERLWHWIELPLYISYFLVTTIFIADPEDRFRQTRLFSDIRTVLEMAEAGGDIYQVERVDVLIPHHKHDGEGFKLARIKEVWRDTSEHPVTSYVLYDGSHLLDTYCEPENVLRAKLKLAASF
jgi:hypothetical protein